MRVSTAAARATALLRLGRRADANDAGMSLVEVIVSISLVTIVMASAGLFFVNNLRTTGGQSQRQEAVFLADRQLETVQALAPSQLLSGRTSSSVTALLATSGASSLTSQDWTSSGNYDATATSASSAAVPTSQTTTVNSIVYTIRTFINLCTLQSGGSCAPGSTEPTGNAMMYRVTVDVSWNPATNGGCGTSGCDYSASSLIDPHGDPTFNSNISHPAITSVARNNVGSGSTQNIVITGSGFVAGATVSIDTGAGTFGSISSNTGTQVIVAFTAGNVGSYTLAVTNPDGGRATISFTVNAAPNISSVSPTSVSGGVQTLVSLTGTGFQTGGTITANTGSTASATVSSQTAASVRLTAPTSGGTVTLTLTNPDGGSDTINVSVVSAPNVTTISPNAVTTGTTTSLTFTGTDLIGPVSLTPSVGTVNSVTVTSSTSATVSYTAPATGPRSVTFTWRNADGGTDSTLPAFTVNPAAINVATVAPAAGVPVSTTNKTLTLTGTGFQNGATLSASAGTLSTFVVASATSATVNYNAPATAQTVTLTWLNPDGGTDTITFPVNALPTVTNLCTGAVTTCPGGQTATHNASTTFSVIGTNFKSGATVKLQGTTTWFSGASAFISSGVLRVTFTTPNTTGSQSVTVTVTNPDGAVATNTFTVSLT